MFVLPNTPLGDLLDDKNLSLSRSYFITVWEEIKPISCLYSEASNAVLAGSRRISVYSVLKRGREETGFEDRHIDQRG